MGRIKQLMIQMQEWREDMPDLMGQALADAEREFLSERSEDNLNEADNMQLWIQLELPLWENMIDNMHGLGGECDL